MGQRLADRLIGIIELSVFSHHSHTHIALGVFHPVKHITPDAQVWARGRSDGKGIQHRLIQPNRMKRQRRFIDRGKVVCGDHRFLTHVTKEGNLVALALRNFMLGAADQHIGRDADGAQLLHGVLRRLGLQFARCRQIGD